MYIYLYPNGEIRKSIHFTDNDAACCDAGVVTVIDTRPAFPGAMDTFIDNEWIRIEFRDDDNSDYT